DGFSQIKDGLSQIDSYMSQIDSGVTQIDDGTAKIDAAVDEARQKILAGRRELKKKWSEADSAWLDALGEFADLRDELSKALSELEEWEGYEVLCNQFLVRFAPGIDREAVFAEVKKALGDLKISSSFLYENSAVKDKIDMNLAPIRTMSVFMPMIFFVVVLIVVFLFMSLLIRQCRREIGILRALGFSKGGIRALFCGIDFLVSLAAIAIGTGVGWVLSLYVGKIFENFFPLPNYTYTMDIKRSVLAAVLTILVGQLATLIGTTVLSRIQPSEAMSRQTPGSAKVSAFVQAITKKASPFVKFSVVSMSRNKGRFLFSVICLAASVMMIFSSFSFVTSKNEILRQMFDQRIHYDGQVFLTKVPDEELLGELNALPYVTNAEGARYYSLTVSFDGKTSSTVSVNAIPEETDLVSVYGASGEKVSVPHEGIILEKHLAEEIGAKTGDTVKVGDTLMEVVDISDQSVSRFQYISLHQAKALGDGALGAVLCRIDQKDEQKLLEFLTGRSDYLYSVFTHVLYESNAKTFATYDMAAVIIIGFAILVGLIIVVNTAQTNLLEQKKELCVLRTLGFQHSELSRHWFVQSFLHFLFSCVLGLPLGAWLARVALKQLATSGREYVYANGVKEYLLTAALVFSYILISHLITMHSLKKWDIVEAVKDKE
ncbi:MAG: ABC transporter permease, partial [bacterium]